jgi:hypothetical protein
MTLAIPSRRGFLFGASAFLAAPAIVRVASIMPVSVVSREPEVPYYVARRFLSWAEAVQRYADRSLNEPMIIYAHENFARDFARAA